MKFAITLLLATVTTAGGALAADTWPVPDSRFFTHVSGMLAADGYTSIRPVSADNLLVRAYDPDGSEVVLLMHPDNGTVTRSFYVSPNDE